MELIIGGRRYGKTIKALEWVEVGQRTSSYPFWDRVLLCTTSQEADRLRDDLLERAAARGEDNTWGLFYNRVYSVEEWARARVGREPVQLWLDNADLFLQMYLGRGGSSLKGVTWTTREDQPEDKVTHLTVRGREINVHEER